MPPIQPDPVPDPPTTSLGQWADLGDLAVPQQSTRRTKPANRPASFHAPVPPTPRIAKAPDSGLRITSRFNSQTSGRETPQTADEPTGTSGESDVEVIRLSQPYGESDFRTMPAPQATADGAGDSSTSWAGRQRKHHAWGGNKTQGVRWLLLSGAGVIALVIVALVVQQAWLAPPPEVMPSTMVLEEDEPLKEVEGFEISGTSQRESMDLLTRFAHARTVEEALPLIRNSKEVAPLVRANWQPWQVPAGWSTPADSSWTTEMDSGSGFGRITGTLPNFDPFRAYFVREDGVVKLDWEATTGYCATDFTRLARGQGTGGVTRAYVEPADYYSAALPEESYRCFKLLSPDANTLMWGYAPIEGAAELGIRHYFPSSMMREADEKVRAMTLKLAPGPDGARNDQWLISELLHHEWVSP